MVTNQQIVENLNLTGNFLEAAMFSLIDKNTNYAVVAEWPYANTNSKFSGTADLIAINLSAHLESEPLVLFAIECKKVRHEEKVWVFDSNKNEDEATYPFLRIDSNGQRLYTDRTGYIIPDLEMKDAGDTPVYNKGYELHGKNGNLSRNQSEKIFEAVSQANRAFHGIVTNGHKRIFAQYKNKFDGKHFLIVPIVITNADLKIMKYSAEDIDTNEGTLVTEKFTTENKDFIIYDYPLDVDLRLNATQNGIDTSPVKRPTFIVNVSHALKLMDAISKASEF